MVLWEGGGNRRPFYAGPAAKWYQNRAASGTALNTAGNTKALRGEGLRIIDRQRISGGFQQGSELVAVDQHAALAVRAQAPGDHLDRHADLDRLLAQIG